MARPTKYTQEALDLARDYVQNFEDYGDVIPTVAGLACEIGVCRDTIHTWVKEEGKEEFSDIVKGMMSAQERKLVNGGLSGGHNPMISKLLLSKHGYSDKQEVDLSSKDGSMTPKAFTQEQYQSAQSNLDTELDELD